MHKIKKALVAAALTTGVLGAVSGPALAVPAAPPTPPCEVDSGDTCTIKPDPNMHWGNQRPPNG